MQNPNHPAIGDSIKVEPIRDPRSIKNIKKLLADKPRDLALFTLGINTNLRASDLLRVKVGDVRYLEPGGHFSIREKKTGKERIVTINHTVHKAIRNLLLTIPEAADHEPLFQSRKGGKALCVPTLVALVKDWCRDVGLKENYGSHTLRKTFGYQHRVQFNTSVPVLMELFNHSSQRQTMQYLGIQPSELKDAYMMEI